MNFGAYVMTASGSLSAIMRRELKEKVQEVLRDVSEIASYTSLSPLEAILLLLIVKTTAIMGLLWTSSLQQLMNQRRRTRILFLTVLVPALLVLCLELEQSVLSIGVTIFTILRAAFARDCGFERTSLMTVTGFDMVFYTLAFVVPGFILNNTVSTFVPIKSEQLQVALLRYLYFSCLNHAIWSWLIYLLVKTEYSTYHPILAASIWVTIILISPIVLGIVVGLISQKELVRKVLQKVGFSPAHIIPTGWDYRFSKTIGVYWVIVMLKDGTIIPGKFGSKSFASSDSSDRDLYIEEVYSISDTNEWDIVPGTDGVLIRGDQIKCIEFLKESEEMDSE